jgi:hypothetical protein
MAVRTSQSVGGGNQPLISSKFIIQPSKKESISIQSEKREMFWDTQPSYSGRAEVWQLLRMACESSRETAQAILDLESITCPSGRLTDGLYDTYGNHYIIPDFCIGPLESEMESSSLLNVDFKLEKAPSVGIFQADEISRRLTCRLSSGTDIQICVSNEFSIGSLKKIIAKQIECNPETIRIIQLGKILENSLKIKDTKIAENSLIQVFI